MGVTRPLLAVAGIILVSGGCAPDHLTAPAAQPQDSRAAMGQWAGMQNAPLFVVNGRTVQPAAARHLDPNTIAGVTVLKGARAVEQFGPSAENGVVVITLKPGSDAMAAPSSVAIDWPSPRTIMRDAPTANGPAPLFVIDGRIYHQGVGPDLDPRTIDRIDVLKGPAAVDRFGSEASGGAIIVTLKHPAIGR